MDDFTEMHVYDVITGETRNLLASMANPNVVNEYMEIIKSQMKALVDTLNNALTTEDGSSSVGKIMKDLEQTMTNLNSGTGQLDHLLRKSSGDISKSLSNVESLTQELEDFPGG